MIKVGTDPDNKAKYIKLSKHLLIATILITLSLSLVEIPKTYFGSVAEITDGQTADMTIAKIEDQDCQGRETVNLDGKRYVVTDTNMKIAALTDDEPLHEAIGLYSTGKVVENVCFLKPFGECQGFWKGYFASIKYFRDSDGLIFPYSTTYPQYQVLKSIGGGGGGVR